MKHSVSVATIKEKGKSVILVDLVKPVCVLDFVIPEAAIPGVIKRVSEYINSYEGKPALAMAQ